MRNIFVILLVAVIAIAATGCSAVMALKQPSKKNLQVLSAGVDRENVIAYLGAPVSSEKSDLERIDIYQFEQGYSGGAKAARATWHLVADVFTLFIWEIIGMPTEAVFDGEKVSVKVIYDNNNKLKEFFYLNKTAN